MTRHCTDTTVHTPGPWRFDSLVPVEVMTGPRLEVGTFNDPAEKDTATANARLIAAAPDLLAALEGLLAITNCYAPEASAARIAIAKTRAEPEWP